MMFRFNAASSVLASAHRVLACPKTNQGTFVFISAAVARNASRSLKRVTSRSTDAFSALSLSIFARLFAT